MWLVAAHVTLLHLALADAIPSPYQLQCSPAHWLNNTALSNPKHHLRSLKGDGTTPESCCAACAADGGRCASWSFWLPDNCLTFTTIAPAKHEVGSVSGATGPLPRPGPPPPPPPVPPAPPLPPSNPGARNIVFFQCDEMDGRTVDPSHPISKVTRKPNLEVMMERGTNFVGQYCNTPLCAPSRSSMFTGRRTSSIEAWSNIKSLMADVADPSKPDPVCAKIVGYGGATGCVELGRRQNVRTTINLAMKDAGFDVRLYGKMDTGGGPLMTPPGAHATGFHGSGNWSTEPKPQGVKLYFPGDTLHSWAQSANISKAAFARLDMPNKWIDTSHATSFVSDWTTIANCERFLREPSLHKPSSPPFFLYCSVVNPHPPYTSNITWEAYVNRDALSASLARTKETYSVRQHPADVYSTRSEGVPEAWNATVAHDMALSYHGQIAEVDNMVGRVQKALDASGVANETYFIFTSDHGEMHLEHKLVEKMSMYEPSARVPLIITGPGVPAGKIVREFTTLIDLFPTFLDIAQVSQLPDADLQGYSLAPFLNLQPKRGSLAVRPAHVVVEYAGEEVNAPQFMLRLGDLKLIQYGEQPPFISYPPQLFNVTADPYELRNLAPLSEYKSHVAELDKILQSEVDYPEVAKTLLAENRANVVRWMTAVGDHWEALIRTAYLDIDDDDLRKFKTWLAHGDEVVRLQTQREAGLKIDDEQ